MSRLWLAAQTGDLSVLNPSQHLLAKVASTLRWANGSPIERTSLGVRPAQNPFLICLDLKGDIFEFLLFNGNHRSVAYPDGRERSGAIRPTPANALVKLNAFYDGHQPFFATLARHVRLGHLINVSDGNHDRPLPNPYVWHNTVVVDGIVLRGFVDLIAHELELGGADRDEIAECLSRIQLMPMVFDGDVLRLHGDQCDPVNRVRRPLKEYVDPTPPHEVMPMALGDYGVRDSYNRLKRLDPGLSGVLSAPAFFWRVLTHNPRYLEKLALGFIKNLGREQARGVLPDAEQRQADIVTLSQLRPEIFEYYNHNRATPLTNAQWVESMQAIEARTATPLFSNFANSLNFFRRLKQLFVDRVQTTEEARLQAVLEAAAATPAATRTLIHGHRHLPDEEDLGNDRRRIDAGTWITPEGPQLRRLKNWSRTDSPAVITDVLETPDGLTHMRSALVRVVGPEGYLVEANLLGPATEEFDDRELRETDFKRKSAAK